MQEIFLFFWLSFQIFFTLLFAFTNRTSVYNYISGDRNAIRPFAPLCHKCWIVWFGILLLYQIYVYRVAPCDSFVLQKERTVSTHKLCHFCHSLYRQFPWQDLHRCKPDMLTELHITWRLTELYKIDFSGCVSCMWLCVSWDGLVTHTINTLVSKLAVMSFFISCRDAYDFITTRVFIGDSCVAHISG